MKVCHALQQIFIRLFSVTQSLVPQVSCPLVSRLTARCDCAGDLSWLAPVVANQLGSAVASLLTSSLTLASSAPLSKSAAASTFTRAKALLDALQPAIDHQLLATAVAGPMAAALVGPVQQGSALPEAASLLARLVKQFGAEIMMAAPAVALPGAGRTTGMMLPHVACCSLEQLNHKLAMPQQRS